MYEFTLLFCLWDVLHKLSSSPGPRPSPVAGREWPGPELSHTSWCPPALSFRRHRSVLHGQNTPITFPSALPPWPVSSNTGHQLPACWEGRGKPWNDTVEGGSVCHQGTFRAGMEAVPSAWLWHISPAVHCPSPLHGGQPQSCGGWQGMEPGLRDARAARCDFSPA